MPGVNLTSDEDEDIYIYICMYIYTINIPRMNFISEEDEGMSDTSGAFLYDSDSLSV